ncbi:ribosomal prt L37 [Enterospora canceri]|uniref:Ribosomal protein L37 n=1 Tax=Enterospora canceri TaxID=1081671 RepID=A0A1Y1S6G8_9MICR|nr:ribosomal prt L37 [Enterospora canceri]
MSKGTPSMGKRTKRNHLLCPRCGHMAYHKQRAECASCAYPEAKKRTRRSEKAKRREHGKKKYIKKVIQKSKTGFRQHPLIMKMQGRE